MKALITYLEQYALLSLEKREKLSALIGEHTLDLDLDTGLVRFSGGFEFPFQVLGTESHNTLTWLWAWAEEQAEVPPDLLESARQMKEWGSLNRIPECTMPSVDLNRADGLLFSLIASEVCQAGCFYEDSYDGGALFLLLFGQTIEMQAPLDAAGLERQLLHLASSYDLNHRNALLSYLRAKELLFSEEGPLVSARLASGEELRAEFDADGAVKTINGAGFES
ncbi:MAG: hypothetical protein A2010_04560 [Nitrospirae bacterium GWD2_57_9]|nr:MAG: hypothetical protein A2010_04560 [Nitrospirae bacterium GWD2_57_9]OGW49818.1 MAG: hypothetical protein A2078_03500 [Nitrospirae bacterium GWC2_57_9]